MVPPHCDLRSKLKSFFQFFFCILFHRFFWMSFIAALGSMAAHPNLELPVTVTAHPWQETNAWDFLQGLWLVLGFAEGSGQE